MRTSVVEQRPSLSFIRGEGQVARVTTAFKNPLQIALLRPDNAIPNSGVTFTANGAIFSDGSQTAHGVTDENGIAALPPLVAGDARGKATVTAQSDDYSDVTASAAE